jgi:hypothetical protein
MAEPYRARKIPDHWRTSLKRQVIGTIVALSGLRLIKRETWLIHPRTRCTEKNSIQELTVTDDAQAQPGQQVDSVLYIGFFEIEQGGVIASGDPVLINGEKMGTVAGFSDIHAPNHLNIMVTSDQEFISKYIEHSPDATIVETHYKLGDRVIFGNEP